MADLTIEEKVANMQKAIDSHADEIAKQSGVITEQAKTIQSHEQTIKDLQSKQPNTASAIAKPEKKTPPPVSEEVATVKYNTKPSDPGKGEEKTGKFKLKNPLVLFEGETYPAAEAIKNAALMTYYVEQTWVGTKDKSAHVKEVV